MEKKKQILERINEIKKQIKTNSKDAHFAETLCDELVQKVKEWKHEPTELDCGKAIDTLEGDTFKIVKTDLGVLYHAYSGYNIFATPQTKALYESLCGLVDNKKQYEELSDELKETFDLHLSAMTYVLNIPVFAFTDVEFTYKIAEYVIKYLNGLYEKALEQPLQEETPELNAEFKEATLAMEEVKETLDEAVKEIKANE